MTCICGARFNVLLVVLLCILFGDCSMEALTVLYENADGRSFSMPLDDGCAAWPCATLDEAGKPRRWFPLPPGASPEVEAAHRATCWVMMRVDPA